MCPEATDFYLRQIGVYPVPEHVGTGVDDPARNKVPVSLETLARQASVCTACALAKGRTQVVFGVGNPAADIIFIGEAPGREEDLKGEPFVGRAGKLLDAMLCAIGLGRSSVYIMNVVKCRPPGNRDPRPEEVEACSRWFDAQWNAISPKLVCLLGRVAARHVLQTDASISSLRGRWHEHRGVPVYVTYHPAYLLRSPARKAMAWFDLRRFYRRYRAIQG